MNTLLAFLVFDGLDGDGADHLFENGQEFGALGFGEALEVGNQVGGPGRQVVTVRAVLEGEDFGFAAGDDEFQEVEG